MLGGQNLFQQGLFSGQPLPGCGRPVCCPDRQPAENRAEMRASQQEGKSSILMWSPHAGYPFFNCLNFSSLLQLEWLTLLFVKPMWIYISVCVERAPIKTLGTLLNAGYVLEQNNTEHQESKNKNYKWNTTTYTPEWLQTTEKPVLKLIWATVTLTPCWWECKWAQLFWQHLQKLNIHLP